jgi:hypothetical protein
MNDATQPKPSNKFSTKIALFLFTVCFTLTLFVAARDMHASSRQQSQSSAQSQSQTPAKPSSAMPNMPNMDMPPTSNSPAARAANADMSDMDPDMHMNMAHMFMTTLRPPNATDQARAAQIVDALRPALEK